MFHYITDFDRSKLEQLKYTELERLYKAAQLYQKDTNRPLYALDEIN